MFKKLSVVLMVVCIGVLANAHAQTSECRRIVPSEGVGYGYGQSQTDQFNEALSEAMAEAISRELGVFIGSKTELVEVIRTTGIDGIPEIESSSELREEISRQFSGLILSFDVIDRGWEPNGILRVTIVANVCTDPRIAVLSNGTEVVRDAFIGALAEDVRDAGWHIARASGFQDQLSKEQMLAISLETGATYVVVNHMEFHDRGTWQNHLDQWTVTANILLHDVRTLSVIDTLSLSATELGANDVAAQQQAAVTLAGTLAQQLTQRYLSASERLQGEIFFQNVRREGTKYDLERLINNIRGVVAVTDSAYNPNTSTVHVKLDLSAQLCEGGIAREVAADRSAFVLRLDGCANDQATLWMERE